MSRTHPTDISLSATGKGRGKRRWLPRFFRRLKPDEIQVSNNGKLTAVYTDKSELKQLVAIERERLEIDRERLEIERERLDDERRNRSPQRVFDKMVDWRYEY